jgi:hypothetical protein
MSSEQPKKQRRVSKKTVAKSEPVVVVEEPVVVVEEPVVVVEEPVVVVEEPVVVVEDPVVVVEESGDVTTLLPRDVIQKELGEILEIVSSLSEDCKQQKNKAMKVRLGDIKKKIGIVQKSVNKNMKSKSTTYNRRVSSGFLKSVSLSDDMYKFLGVDPAQSISRVDVTKLICAFVKERNLQNTDDRRLFKVKGTDLEHLFPDIEQMSWCELQKQLKLQNHIK